MLHARISAKNAIIIVVVVLIVSQMRKFTLSSTRIISAPVRHDIQNRWENLKWKSSEDGDIPTPLNMSMKMPNKRRSGDMRSEMPEILDNASLEYIFQGRNTLRNYYLYNEEKSLYNQSILSFVHYPKGGGTTVKDCLTIMAKKLSLKPPILTFVKNIGQITEHLLNGDMYEENNIFAGTNGFGICEFLDSKYCTYFTILRDPYDRMVSHYMFCKNGGESGADCNNKTITEFAVRVRSVFFKQLTIVPHCTRTTGSLGGSRDTGNWTCDISQYKHLQHMVTNQSNKVDMILDYAIANLDKWFAVIGITEELDVSLQLLQETFGLPFYDMCKDIHSNNGMHGKKIDNADTQRRLEAKNILMANEEVRSALNADVQLYNRAREIFNMEKMKFEQRSDINKS